MRNRLQCGQENQHVVAGERPCGDVCHGSEHNVLAEEINVYSDGRKTFDNRRNLTVIQVHPNDGCNHTWNGVRQEVAETEARDVLDHERIDDHRQSQRDDNHQRNLNEGVDQHPAHTGPEIAGRKHVLEILEPYEFIHQFAAAVSATAFGDLTEETGVDGIENRDDEYDGEQYAEWRHERPSCSILAALRISALWFRRMRCCSHDVPIFRIGCHSSLMASFTVRIAVSKSSSRERSAGFSRSVESARSIHRKYSRGGIFVRNVMDNGAKPCVALASHRRWRGYGIKAGDLRLHTSITSL